MSRVVVLGAGGGVGAVVVRALRASGEVDDLVAADLRAGEGIDALVDAADEAAVDRLLRDADLVVHCAGPFYRLGPPVLRAALAAGCDYVDVCDDLAPTLTMLDLDGAARERGVHALLGMGNSPGLANVFARLAADSLLDQVTAVDIQHVHGGEPDEGPAVLAHRIAAMTDDVPLFLDGAMVTVRQLEPSGAAHVREVDFRGVGRLPAFPYPHPETVTLPRHLPGVRRVTNLGVVEPLSYFRLTQDLVRAGTPVDEAIARLRAARPALLAEAGLTGPRGCLRVDVRGEQQGAPHRWTLQLASSAAAAGEGTGIPAAAGALLALRGRVAGPGVLPPEAAVDPGELLATAFGLADRLDLGGPQGAPLAVLEHEAPDGTVEELPLR